MLSLAKNLAAALSVCLVCLAFALGERAHFSWNIHMKKAQGSLSHYTLLGVQEGFILDVSLRNVGKRTILLPKEFRERFSFQIHEDQIAEELNADWDDEIGRQPNVEEPTTSLELRPDETVTLGLRLNRKDGQPIGPGSYRISIQCELGSTLLFSNGEAWDGSLVNYYAVPLTIKEVEEDFKTFLEMEGDYYYATGDYSRALDFYSQLLHGDPEVLETHVRLGGVYLRLGRYEEAVVLLEKAMPAYKGTRSVVPDWLASAYVGLGRVDLAMEVLLQLMSQEQALGRVEGIKDELRRGAKSEKHEP